MKKYISMMLCVLLILSVVVGCTQQPAPSESAASSEKASNEQPTQEAPREAELNIMMSFPQYMEQWENYAKQFEDKMLAEQNIKVTVNLEMPSSDQYDSVLQARLTGDDAPDLFTIHRNNIGTYNDAGYLTDLSAEPLAAKLYDNVKATCTVDGKLLVLPIESTAWGCLFNMDIFEKCGLTPPNTLDELKNACEVLKQNGYTPFLLSFQDQWVPQLMTALTLGGKVSGEVPDWVDRMNKDAGSYEEMRDIFGPIDVIMRRLCKWKSGHVGTGYMGSRYDHGSESGYEAWCNGVAGKQ
jgi:raffinose/stachyose/melibiose transport system substrate-binding protein